MGDGYGYNIYQATADSYVVMRDVWGVKDGTAYPDTANNAPDAQSHAVAGDIFHNQYGTINIGDVGTPTDYNTTKYPDQTSDFYPILTKTRRKIEDFNVVMANPTYEGHGFLNFVATYHDHVDQNRRNAGTVEPYAGYRFYSTISGYQNVGTFPTADCNNIRSDRIDLAGRPSNGRENDARCGGAIYENFGDWYLRPPQKYNTGENAQPYWSYIQPDGFASSDTLWTPNSQRDDDTNGSRGFAISSFPHNELGQDFRFNIRTLHNMGMGVAKTNQMMTNRSATSGIIDRDQAIWSYYMYAVDTIKIAFPEYVARVNHCHFKSHKTHPNCM